MERLFQDVVSSAEQHIRGIGLDPQVCYDDKTTHSRHRVALCMTTKGRLWQLQHVLPLNLLHVWPHREWCNVHLVVADDPDALHWIGEHLEFAVRHDVLRVYGTNGKMQYWHASVAKNTSHMVANEEILVNVDGDNLIGRGFPMHVAESFQQGFKVVHYNGHMEGNYGRIAVLRCDFCELAATTKMLYPWGIKIST